MEKYLIWLPEDLVQDYRVMCKQKIRHIARLVESFSEGMKHHTFENLDTPVKYMNDLLQAVEEIKAINHSLADLDRTILERTKKNEKSNEQ